MMLAKKRDAISSGYMNNCGLNSLIHLWLNLPSQTFDMLYQNFPVYKMIHQEYLRSYGNNPNIGLDDPALTLENFKKVLVNGLNNPWDKELVWGPVFREVLVRLAQNDILRANSTPVNLDFDINEAQYEFNQQELQYILVGRSLDWRVLRLLSQEMGFDMTVHNQAEQYTKKQIFAESMEAYEPLTHQFPPSLPQTEDIEPILFFTSPEIQAQMKAELFFTGNHYNFTYPNANQNDVHNAKRGEMHSFLKKNIPGLLQQEIKKDDDISLLFQLKAVVDSKKGKQLTDVERMVLAMYHQFKHNFERAKIDEVIKSLVTKLKIQPELLFQAQPQQAIYLSQEHREIIRNIVNYGLIQPVQQPMLFSFPSFTQPQSGSQQFQAKPDSKPNTNGSKEQPKF